MPLRFERPARLCGSTEAVLCLFARVGSNLQAQVLFALADAFGPRPCSDRSPPVLDLVGIITTVYLMWGRSDTTTTVQRNRDGCRCFCWICSLDGKKEDHTRKKTCLSHFQQESERFIYQLQGRGVESSAR